MLQKLTMSFFSENEPKALKAFRLFLILVSLMILSLFVISRITNDTTVTRTELRYDGVPSPRMVLFSSAPFSSACRLIPPNDTCNSMIDCKNPTPYNHSLYKEGFRTIIRTQACVFSNNLRFVIDFGISSSWIGVSFVDKDIVQEEFNYQDVFIFPNNLIYYTKFQRKAVRKLIRNWRGYLGFAPEYEETSSYLTTFYGINSGGQPELDLRAETLDTEFYDEVRVYTLFGLFGTLGGVWSLMLIIYTGLFGTGKIKPLGVLHKHGCFARKMKKTIDNDKINNFEGFLKRYVVDTEPSEI